MFHEEEFYSLEEKIDPKTTAMPVKVEILTPDYEIRGIVFVSRAARDDRRLTDLLNDPERRFLAVTDAEIINRTKPGSIRRYSFLQVQIGNILMLHPSSQTLLNESGYSHDESSRFENFRAKLNEKTG